MYKLHTCGGTQKYVFNTVGRILVHKMEHMMSNSFVSPNHKEMYAFNTETKCVNSLYIYILLNRGRN